MTEVFPAQFSDSATCPSWCDTYDNDTNCWDDMD